MQQRYQISMRFGVFWSLVLLIVPFLARPVTAAAPTTALDVARIDTFVREQVRRHGIPGLALALVEGDRIIRLGGYGKADQTGRAVTPQPPFILASASKPITPLVLVASHVMREGRSDCGREDRACIALIIAGLREAD